MATSERVQILEAAERLYRACDRFAHGPVTTMEESIAGMASAAFMMERAEFAGLAATQGLRSLAVGVYGGLSASCVALDAKRIAGLLPKVGLELDDFRASLK